MHVIFEFKIIIAKIKNIKRLKMFENKKFKK